MTAGASDKCPNCSGFVGSHDAECGDYWPEETARLRSLVLVERMARIDAETKLALAVEKQKARRAKYHETIEVMKETHRKELHAAMQTAVRVSVAKKITRHAQQSAKEWRERALAAEARIHE